MANLKNGGKASEDVIVNSLGAFDELTQSTIGVLALYNLLQVCCGKATTITEVAQQQELQGVGLVQSFDASGAPKILDSVRDITVSAVEFRGLTVAFQDPRKSRAITTVSRINARNGGKSLR